jgi:hypothetical protein
MIASVATRQNEFHPVYISNGNIRNNVRHAHRDGVSIVGFLCIPTGEPFITGYYLVHCPNLSLSS